MKKLFALVLACMMLLGSASALTLSTDYHDYVNWPVTDQGYTYTIGIKLINSVSDWTPEKNWFFNWASEKTGLNFEFEGIQAAALKDQKQLMFNSDQLPDVLFGMDVSTVEIVKYGVQEGMLLPLNEFITPEIMPNLCKWLDAYPQARVNMTAPDGNYYSLPLFYQINRSAGASATRVFVNQTWLDEKGIAKPQTLEDLVTVLYAYKADHPDWTPIGCSAAGNDLRDFLLNAYGFICTPDDDFGMGLSLRDGKLVVAAADPVFKEFLTLLNQFYNDGIIYKDFFLLDKDTVKLAETNLECFMIGNNPSVGDYTNWSNWTACYPLTSEFSSERKILGTDMYRIGGCCLSSYCEHAEEFMRFMDFFYTDLGMVYSWNGPLAGSEDAMGREDVGFYIDENGNAIEIGVANGTYSSDYVCALYTAIPSNKRVGVNACSIEHPELDSSIAFLSAVAGVEVRGERWNITGSGDNYYRASMEEFVSPYETSEYPFYIYLSEDQTNRVNELKTVISPYVEKEVASFITGARSLDEFDQFISELEGMGIREYEQLYRDATGLK